MRLLTMLLLITSQAMGQSSQAKIFSANVADSFTISVQTPAGHDQHPQKKYPVVYILDANLYFNIFASIVKEYSQVGLLQPMIVVGIGYKDLGVMDSLRSRDYTYPKALAKYEMEPSGGADKFLSFIRSELVPYIDNLYHTDTANRILMGHSLGGYFTAWALMLHLKGKTPGFTRYIAASPSLNYNDYYLLKQYNSLSMAKRSNTSAYICYGSLEDEEDAGEPGVQKVASVASQLKRSLFSKHGVRGKVVVYSELDHMNTAIPAFVKGLQLLPPVQ